MNERRRTSLRKSIDGLRVLRDNVASVADDEEDSMLNVPESLQSSDRFHQMEDSVDYLKDAVDGLDEAIEKIESAIS